MNFTRHAQWRCKQRNITKERVIEAIQSVVTKRPPPAMTMRIIFEGLKIIYDVRSNTVVTVMSAAAQSAKDYRRMKKKRRRKNRRNC